MKKFLTACILTISVINFSNAEVTPEIKNNLQGMKQEGILIVPNSEKNTVSVKTPTFDKEYGKLKEAEQLTNSILSLYDYKKYFELQGEYIKKLSQNDPKYMQDYASCLQKYTNTDTYRLMLKGNMIVYLNENNIDDVAFKQHIEFLNNPKLKEIFKNSGNLMDVLGTNILEDKKPDAELAKNKSFEEAFYYFKSMEFEKLAQTYHMNSVFLRKLNIAFMAGNIKTSQMRDFSNYTSTICQPVFKKGLSEFIASPKK